MKKTLALSFIFAASMIVLPPPAADADGYYVHYGRPGRIIVATPSYHIYRGGWRNPLGRVDIEIEPKDAQVFVDGNFVGTAKKLDGWPHYLYLRQGTYEITLVHPGYETVTHTVAIFPRQRMTLELPMVPGESTPPPEPKPQKDAQETEKPATES